MNISTQLIHDACAIDLNAAVESSSTSSIQQSVITPIFQTSTFMDAPESGQIFYTRLHNNPNHEVLARRIASIENAEKSIVTSSGMAAISTCLMSLLKSGDHVITQACLYGGTHQFMTKDLGDMGVDYDMVCFGDVDAVRSLIRPNTKMIYLESMTNPTMHVPDFDQIIALAKAHNIVTVIDNTFLTPMNFTPIDIGFDLVVHSCTKYMNGHSDVTAGCISGSTKLIEHITEKFIHFGGVLDPNSCFLLERGLKTLSLRMERHNNNGLKVARYLENHSMVDRVYYTGLNGHQCYDNAEKYFRGHSSMVSFIPKGDLALSKKIVDRLHYFCNAVSLGGVESLVTIPSQTTHSVLSEECRVKANIPDHLIRLAVGIEDVEDLIADLEKALSL